MNAELSERFKGSERRTTTPKTHDSAPESSLELTLNLQIREYVSKQEQTESTAKPETWLSQPEVPTKEELSVTCNDLLPNKVKGPYKNTERYLKGHYGLLREDAVGSLRDAVLEFCENISRDENHKYSVYEQVHVTGFTFARRGIAARIKFTTRRAKRRINWENSKRLVSGSIVALLPSDKKPVDLNDMTVAVVAARPLAGVLCEPPEIDIYFGRTEDIQIDPQKEWIMIEAKQGYFEAYRHTLRALQKLSQEKYVHYPLTSKVIFPH